MRPIRKSAPYLACAAVLLASGSFAAPALAQCPFISGSTGTDGAFTPTANMTVPLPPDGVLNYTTVNIPAGVTVTFQRNAKNTPVVMLASGNVTIVGAIDVNGSNANGATPGKGGPGGFDGGMGAKDCGGGGLGPGGGGPGCGSTAGLAGGGGGFGTPGASGAAPGLGAGGQSYGNDLLTPLIGGSGGGGGNYPNGFGGGGGGGGGALLIASSTTLNLTGTIRANGGNGHGTTQATQGSAGSGGGIRLIANSLTGTGSLAANGGGNYYAGGRGRVRVETCMNTFRGTLPADASTSLAPTMVFVAGIPSLSIVSVNGVPAPEMPMGSFGPTPDVPLPAGTTTATVNLAATGIPPGTTVSVTVTPELGTPSTVNTVLTGTEEASTATAEITLAPGTSIVGAQTTITVAQAGSAPVVVGSLDGEKVEKVRLGATFGRRSSLTYITASGKEYPQNLNSMH